MAHATLLRLFALLVAAGATASAGDREIVISPSGAGTLVIGPAVNSAPAGSVIRLRKGLYREIVSISKPVSLVADEGAVIDPSEPFVSRWQPAPSYGAGVYRAMVDRPPASLFIDGKILAQVNSERPETMAEGPWNWKQLLAAGAPQTGFRYIRGLWLYRRDARAVFVHLENDANPSARNWSAVWTRDPVVSLRGTHDASIRGLTLSHGYSGAAITEGCRLCSVTHCKVGPWDKDGILVRNGATESLVEANEIFRDSYEDLTPVTVSRPGSGLSISRDWYEVWQIHKLAGLHDRVGISITLSGEGNRLHANRIHDVFDGIDLGEGEIESLDAPVADPAHDRGAEIWENIIERTGDSGIEVGGPAVNVRIHHNVLRRTHGGLRYKLPRIGPVFIYRNVLIEGAPNNIWYSMDDSPAEGYVYHNTVVGGRTGLMYNGWRKHHDIGAPRWHYLNNLFLAERGMFENRDPGIPVNFTIDYNVVLGEHRPYPGDPSRDSHSRYVSEVKLAPGFPPKPLPGSPAIDAGLDLSTYFHGKPLPGCDPGYFRGKAPDAGAFEIE
jgi:parallel beta helix pectate lyase-like protein